MIHITNDAESKPDHVVQIAQVSRLGVRQHKMLRPGETIDIDERDGDLISVFDTPSAIGVV